MIRRSLKAMSGLIPRRVAQPERKATLTAPISQACTGEQFLEAPYAAWCSAIGESPRFHRKQWEFCYILQVLACHDMMQEGRRGLGFGVGREPLVSALAARGAEIVATDAAPDSAAAQFWSRADQFSETLSLLNERRLCPPDLFARKVRHLPVDMNAIPEHLVGFDFCWSACALEHLGSIDAGLAFIVNSLKTLRPGGLAVHTTELNCRSDRRTLTKGETVLFRKSDFKRLAEQLTAAGHTIELTFDLGLLSVDKHIDVPPYSSNDHLKLRLEGHVTTSFGLVITKAG